MSNQYAEIKTVLDKFVTPKESWSPVEKALFTPEMFFTNYKKNQELLLPAIKHSFSHHYENNVLFKRLCEVDNVSVDNIKTLDDAKLAAERFSKYVS